MIKWWWCPLLILVICSCFCPTTIFLKFVYLILFSFILLAVPQDSMFKNRLQEYAQKAAISLPSYHTINEGSSHAPQFRSTVVFNGATYTSPKVFSHRKAAEMDVARIALLSLAPQMSLLTSGHLRPLIREQSCSLVQEVIAWKYHCFELFPLLYWWCYWSIQVVHI